MSMSVLSVSCILNYSLICLKFETYCSLFFFCFFLISEFFKALVDNGHTDLNDLFVRTYGPLYVQHSQVFEDLFENLKGYYYGVDVDLVQVMDDFFVVLMQKMFKLLNPQYNYNDEFWGCMTQYMDDLKPFGEVPAKLTTQVKRAFIAARTFVQGLAIGRDVVIRVSKVSIGV